MTEKHIKAAVALIPCHPAKDDLQACKQWLFTTDNPQKPWFRRKGVSLQDVADNYGQWLSTQDQDTPSQQNGYTPPAISRDVIREARLVREAQQNGHNYTPASLQALDDYTYAEPPTVLPKARHVATRHTVSGKRRLDDDIVSVLP